jgi:hypothetical protein
LLEAAKCTAVHPFLTTHVTINYSSAHKKHLLVTNVDVCTLKNQRFNFESIPLGSGIEYGTCAVPAAARINSTAHNNSSISALSLTRHQQLQAAKCTP